MDDKRQAMDQWITSDGWRTMEMDDGRRATGVLFFITILNLFFSLSFLYYYDGWTTDNKHRLRLQKTKGRWKPTMDDIHKKWTTYTKKWTTYTKKWTTYTKKGRHTQKVGDVHKKRMTNTKKGPERRWRRVDDIPILFFTLVCFSFFILIFSFSFLFRGVCTK